MKKSINDEFELQFLAAEKAGFTFIIDKEAVKNLMLFGKSVVHIASDENGELKTRTISPEELFKND